jgi:hypothetical protein
MLDGLSMNLSNRPPLLFFTYNTVCIFAFYEKIISQQQLPVVLELPSSLQSMFYVVFFSRIVRENHLSAHPDVFLPGITNKDEPFTVFSY